MPTYYTIDSARLLPNINLHCLPDDSLLASPLQALNGSVVCTRPRRVCELPLNAVLVTRSNSRDACGSDRRGPGTKHLWGISVTCDRTGCVIRCHCFFFPHQVGASSLRGHQVTVPSTPWSDIGGMDEVRALFSCLLTFKQRSCWVAVLKAMLSLCCVTHWL